MSTSFASRLGIEHPLIQAPMAGSTSPALVAAVSNAGALGSLGAGYLEPQAILDQAAQVRALSERPYAVGLFVLPDEFEAERVDLPLRWAGYTAPAPYCAAIPYRGPPS